MIQTHTHLMRKIYGANGGFKIKRPFPMRGHHIGSTSHDIQGLDISDKINKHSIDQ